MPPADQYNDDLFRLFLYGEEKTRKTWWIMRAVQAGFNVHMLDCDDGAGIKTMFNRIHKPTPEEFNRLNIIPVKDTLDSKLAAIFITALLANRYMVFDEDARKIRTDMSQVDLGNAHYVINPKKLDSNDIIVVDSWTALVSSVDLKFADELGVDITTGDKSGEELYGKDYKFLNWILSQFKALPCHLVVIGHQQVHQKMKQVKKNDKLIRETDGNPIIQPISSSAKHSGMIGKHFSDILYFYNTPEGNNRINTAKSGDRMGGCRHVEPGVYAWEAPAKPDSMVPKSLTFSDFLRYADLQPVEPRKSEAIIWTSSGVMPEFPGSGSMMLHKNQDAITVPSGATATVGTAPVIAPPAKPNSLGALFAIKK